MSEYAVIAGVGGCLPPRSVTNHQLASTLDTSDEWIRRRTGIARRRLVDQGTATSDLAAAAGGAALASAGVVDADLVVLATTTPDRRCPATAPLVAARLGLGEAAAFDLSAACSGFVYALAVAASCVAAGTCETALVIGADTYSTIIDPLDRDTAVIFGDGAGAVLLRRGAAEQPGALLGFDLGSDGAREPLFAIAAGGSRSPDPQRERPRRDHYVAMRGRELYVQAVQRMADSSRAVLGSVGWQAADLDAVVAHQANQRILDAVAQRLGVPAERCVSQLGEVGNTAAASVPLALADALDRQAAPSGGKALFTAFGAGLTWASAALLWPDAKPVTAAPAAASASDVEP